MELGKKQIALVVAAACVVPMAMTACSSTPGTGASSTNPPSSSASDTGAAVAGGPATAWFLSGQPKEAMYDSAFDTWNAAHPDQKITYETYANDDFKEKIRTAMGAGNAPTLVWNWGAFGVVSEYVAANQIVPLDGKVDQALSRVLPSVAKAGAADGHQWGVPNSDVQPVVLFYNKELFQKAGVTAPITTWDDLMAAIPKFKAIGVSPFSVAAQSKWPDLMWLEYLADRVGGPQTFDDVAANKPNAWTSPEMLKALGYIKDLVDAGAFQDGFTSTAADNGADIAMVWSGKSAMILQGSWCYGSFKNDAPDFVSAGSLGTFPFPTVSGGKGDPADIAGNPSNYFSIASSANPAAQQTAIDWLNNVNLNDDMVKALIDAGGIPPTANAQAALAASPDADFLTQGYNLVLNAPNFQASWDQVLSSSAAQELLTDLDKLFQGQMTPQQFGDDMNTFIGK